MDISSTEPKYKIGVVARLTGISQHLLRMWERRYSVVDAHRTDTGRRQYSDADVRRLMLIKTLVDRGDSIGQIAALDNEALKERVEQLTAEPDQLVDQPSTTRVRVAVYGEYLPTMMAERSIPGGEMDVTTRCHSLMKFQGDIRKQQPDVLVIEFPVLNEETVARLQELSEIAGGAQVVLVYGFGPSRQLTRLRRRGIRTLRIPATLEEILAAVRELKPVPARIMPGLQTSAIDPLRVRAPLFTPQSLARLADTSNTIECECPTHLVDLVKSLAAFEAYSESCESRNDDDAALHAYLHATTSQARGLMEDALKRVAEAEGLLQPDDLTGISASAQREVG